MNRFVEWCQDTTVFYGCSAGELIGLIILVFVAAMLAYMVIRDEAYWYTQSEDGTETIYRIRSGKHTIKQPAISIK